MPTIGNKRVTQLVELTSNEVIPEDLFLIIDLNANESKKIRASELGVWLQASSSFYAIRAITADTASYILGSNVVGLVSSASYALSSSISSFAQLSSQSLSVISASYALTSSFALNSNSSGSDTSSYLLYQGFPNGTASYALNSLTSNASSTSSFLLYFGGNNGTASYAITTQNVLHTTTSDTASYFNNFNTASAVATASYAFFAQVSDPSNTASYLIFSPNNGTASYAMAAQSIAGIKDYGIFLADTQSAYKAQLDDVDIFWSTQNYARTPIEAMGTVVIPFTSSAPTNGTLYLSAIDRNTGFETVIDSTPITFNLSPTMGTWGNYDSGSVKTTFSLMGQPNLSGSYLVFISSSNNIQIETTRTVRFDVSSESDILSSFPNIPIAPTVFPSSSVVFTFTSTDGGPFTDKITGLLFTMSLNKKIFTLNAIGQSMSSLDYFWTFNDVTASNFSNNALTRLSGVPNSLTYLSCSNCVLSSFYTFASSSLSVLNCNGNFITSLSGFPTSMSYIDCSNNSITALGLPLTLSYLNCSLNQITSLPSTLPYGLTTFLANSNNIQLLPSVLPDSIISMSIDNNTSLLNFSATPLPSQSVYLSFNNCPIGSLPTIPVNVLYLSSYSCSLLSFAMDSITSDLVSNGMISGTLNIRGNGTPSPASLSNMTLLQSNGWTTLYDV